MIDAFQGYVGEWEQAARSDDPFVWYGHVDAALLRTLAAHWALDALRRLRPVLCWENLTPCGSNSDTS